MKKLIFIALIAAFTAPAMAVATLAFSQSTGGAWDYTASGSNSGTISFDPLIVIDKGLGDSTDPLVGSEIVIPTLDVSYDGTDYILTPTTPPSPPQISIIESGGETVFTGELSVGKWDIVDAASSGYAAIKGDITIASVDTSVISSPTLDALKDALDADNKLDFALSMDNAGTDILSKVQNAQDIDDGSVSGSAVIVPAPGAFLLAGMGTVFVGYIKKRRMLN